MRHLLDTTIVSNLVRDPHGRVADRVTAIGEQNQLELAGTTIGGKPLLIGAQAMALDHTLVTDNDQEFARVDGLRVENWLSD